MEKNKILYKENIKRIEFIDEELSDLSFQDKKRDFFKPFKDFLYYISGDRPQKYYEGIKDFQIEEKMEELKREKDFLMNASYVEWARNIDDLQLRTLYATFTLDRRYCEKNILNVKNNWSPEVIEMATDRVLRANALEKEVKIRKLQSL